MAVEWRPSAEMPDDESHHSDYGSRCFALSLRNVEAAHRRADGSVLAAALLSQVRWCSLQTAIEMPVLSARVRISNGLI
jgi:hypothetical protein